MTPTQTNRRSTPTRTRGYLLALGAAGAITIGGLAAANVASAQTDDGTVVEDLPLQVDPPTDDETPPTDGEEPTSPGDEERQGRRGCGGRGSETIAEAIGIEADELRAALADGQTVAEVATENGVDPDSVVAAIVEHAQERIDAKVADGTLTQAEADERLADATERANDRVFDTAGPQPEGIERSSAAEEA